MLALSIVAASSSAHVVAPDSVSATRAAKKKETRPGWQIAGAVKLAKGDVKKVSNRKRTASALCGKVVSKRFKNGRWIPGSQILSGKTSGWFLSLTQESLNLKKKALRLRGGDRKKLLALANSKRLRAMRERNICNTLNTSGSGATPAQSLRIDLSGAVGLALKGTARALPRAAVASTDSNLEAITADGQVRSAVSSGAARIDKFFISPNGKVYLTGDFSATSMGHCFLAEVPAGGGDVTCVDSTLTLRWSSPGDQSQSPPIQFDASGAVYYLGSNSNGSTVLRRNSGSGAVRDLVTDNVYVYDFLVQPDGTVFLSGTTSLTGASWLRKINPMGGLQTLFTGSHSNSTPIQWIMRFPDENIYISQMNIGFARYLTSSDAMDSQFWVGNGGQFTGVSIFINGPLRTTVSGKVYGIASGGALTQYFPVPGIVSDTGLSAATIVQPAMNHLLIAGTNGSGQNVLMLFDTTDGSSRQLIGPSNEIEMYHLNYTSASGKILFDGLRFSDNRYVLGEVDVNTGEVRTTAALATKWQDFQTFG